MALALLLTSQLLPMATGLVSQLGPQQQRLGPQKEQAMSRVQRFKPHDNEFFSLGMMNRVGVTKYSHSRLQAVRSKDNKSWWPEAERSVSQSAGASDLSDNVSWGWHHPNGVYNTIPVGAPLIDSDMNIYLGTDDAIRKFTSEGELLWVYGPRGQLAAAPSLLDMSSRRFKEMYSSLIGKHRQDSGTGSNLLGARRQDSGSDAASNDFEDAEMVGELDPRVIKDSMEDMEAEEDLKPSWAASEGENKGKTPVRLFSRVKTGDEIKVRPGVGYHHEDEHYQAGEKGNITKVFEEDGVRKATIKWSRTGKQSVETMESVSKLFRRVKTMPFGGRSVTLLVGSTTSGYVFAMDVATSEEVWTDQVSEQIAGVKGVVSGYGGVVLVATDRCTDRYCYKYRSLVNPLTPGNTKVRALLAMDGSPLWEFKPTSPVWNFVPQYSDDGTTVMFSDGEGTVYCLGLLTGTLIWKREGAMGTYTQASAVYNGALNQVFAFGEHHYEGEACNPYVPAGIQWPCSAHVGSPGWVRAYNASSGHLQWEKALPEPPSSASVGMLNTPRFHYRVVVTMGKNCRSGAESQVWALDPHSGHDRWRITGPTLWTDMCAGDKEGGDVRRAMGGRAACVPGTWSAPVIDTNGDIYVGSQVGVLQRFGADTPDATGARNHKLLSTLSTGVAFQDNAIAIVPGMMVVSTCTSLIVFQTYLSSEAFGNDSTWDYKPPDSHYPSAAGASTAPLY